MQINDLINKSREIKDLYDAKNNFDGDKAWGVRERVEGLVSDVGDLMKLVMAKEGIPQGENVDEKLKHEVMDCLWSVVIIADELGIDIETEFPKQMDQLKQRIKV